MISKKDLLKKISLGIASLALVVPLANLNNTNVNARRRHARMHRVYRHRRRAVKRHRRRTRTHKVYRHHSHRNYALSYSQAKRAVHKAYDHKDLEDDVFDLHDNGRYGGATHLTAQFGAKAEVYFSVKRSGRYAHIHTAIHTGDAGWVHNWYYRTYKIRRNATVRI